MNRRLLLQLAAALALSLASIVAIAAAARSERADIHVHDAFARASIGAAKTGVVYLTVHNHSEAADRLLGASTPVAERSELHAHELHGEIMRMRRIEAVEVGLYDTIEFKPGAMHVMLFGLKAPLKEGGSFPLTLAFEDSGPITIEVPVKSIAEGAITHQGHGASQPSQ